MNKPIRILLCDDSSVVRRLIKTALASIKDIDVIAEAPNGQKGGELAESAKPDIIIMDVEMPIMDGIDAVRLIRHKKIRTPIIMFSSLTSSGAEATMDAIDAGANDFATKPANVGHVQNALAHVRSELVPLIRRWGQIQQNRNATRNSKQPAIPTTVAPGTIPPTTFAPAPAKQAAATPTVVDRPMDFKPGKISAIGIGVSTGGPQALAELFKALPKELSIPIFIVQHMPPMFTAMLADRLAKIQGHRVREAKDGETVRPGDVFLAPGDYHMIVKNSGPNIGVVVNQEPRVNSCRPAVDPLFQSLAKIYRDKCIGIVLTGMGEDGLVGASALKTSGAKIIVQDEASSVVWGMPGVVARKGLADRQLTIPQIAKEIGVVTSSLQKAAV